MQLASRRGSERAGRDEASIALAVELVNTWNTYFPDPELLDSVDDLRRLCRTHGEPKLADAMRERDLAQARSLRTNLRRAFEAPGERRAVDALNYVIRGSDARPQLEARGRGWDYAFHSPSSEPISELAMRTGLALLDVIRSDGWERFGLCAASPCVAVYVDLSKNRSRKYCSQLCADRMNQAAYRRRQRWSGIPTPLLVAIAGRRRALEAIPSSLEDHRSAASGSR
jgi:predicted RNA-binding Zn ribbon-like protein